MEKQTLAFMRGGRLGGEWGLGRSMVFCRLWDRSYNVRELKFLDIELEAIDSPQATISHSYRKEALGGFLSSLIRRVMDAMTAMTSMFPYRQVK